MHQPLEKPLRHRERVQSLRSFSASATGFTAKNAQLDPLWIDRIRYGVPNIAMRRTVGELYAHLQERKEIGSFRFERTPAGLLVIRFQPNQWLFTAKLSFWKVGSSREGTGRRALDQIHLYRGKAEIILNPTRLFAHMAPEVVAGVAPELASHDLRSWSDRASVLREQTLDGSDNLIPAELVEGAIRLDWPTFCQAYASRVRECIAAAVGLAYDVGGERETGPDRNEPLLVLPAPADWSLQQVEHYHEYATDNAIEAVRRVEPYALSLSRNVAVRQYDRHVRVETVRQDNARSLSMSLDREGAYLVLYAKSLDRLRVEVRFQKEPAAISGLRSAEYAERTNGMAELIAGTSAEAARRLARWIADFHDSLPRGRSSRVKLVALINDLSAVCGTGPILVKMLSLLLAHGGIIATGHAEIDRLVPQMIKRRLFVRVRSTPTRNVVHYRLRPDYAGIVRSIRALEDVPLETARGHFPP